MTHEKHTEGPSVIDPNASIEHLAEEARDEFRHRFGRPPTWITAAPGRVNLIGEHTDYNDGFVLPMAIERYIVLAADASPETNGEDNHRGFRVYSAATEQSQAWPESGPPAGAIGDWGSYLWGVLAECQKSGMPVHPMDIVVNSSVPLGGGLSSSAALEVATATLVEAATGQRFGPVEKALLCQKAEHDYAGVPCGIMDQFSSVMGQESQLILLDCRSADAQLVPLDGDDVSILIANTNVKHELTGGEYAERRSQCEAAARALQVDSLRDCDSRQLAEFQSQMDAILVRRARHVISEIERTIRAADAIRAGNWSHVGQLMYASHDSLRDDYEVSCGELDLLVDLARRLGEPGGVYGSRMTGGGFGGCTVSLIRSDAVEDIAQSLYTDYSAKTRIEPTIFVSRPAQGAFVIQPG